MYYEVKMRFLTTLESGAAKATTNKFLIDAVTFGDSETKAFAELGDNQRDGECLAIVKSKISEVIKVGDGEAWFRVRYTEDIEDDNGKIKKVKLQILIDADNVGQAFDRVYDHLSTHCAGDFKIDKIEDSGFADVLEYDDVTKKLTKVTKNADLLKIHFPTVADDLEDLTIDCAMESKSVSAIDPTDGQAVAFVADPLRLLLESFGLTVSDDQLEEIEEMHEACGTVEFSEFMEIEHGLSLGDAVLVSNLLK